METDDPQPQGRIVTENPNLLALLRENTTDRDGQRNMNGESFHLHGNHPDPSVQRVYVDSPTSNHTDEEYPFVDPNVGDLEESQNFSRREEYQGRPQQSAGRYENRNHEDDRREVPNRTQYVLRSKQNSASREAPTRSSPALPYTRQPPPPAQEAVHIIKPIQSPLSHATQQANREEQEELTALRQEQQYQQDLRDKILQDSKKADEIEIPRLALEALEEEEKPKLLMHPLHDSLEDEYIVGDSLEERQAKSALLKTQQQLQQLQAQQQQTQQQLQQLQQQQQQQQQLQINENYVRDSLDMPPGSMAQHEPFEQYQVNPEQQMLVDQYHEQQQYQTSDNGAHGFMNQPNGYDIDYYGAQLDANGQGHPGYTIAQASGPADAQYYNADDGGNHGYTGPAPPADQPPTTHPSSTASPRHQLPPSPKHNYIKENKEVLAARQPKSTYKNLFINKKEQQNRPPIAPRKKPLDQQALDDAAVSAAPQSAENLWAERSQQLEQKKQQKLAGTKGKFPLKKYPSDSGVNNMPDSAASIRSGPPTYSGQKVPHRVQPIPQRAPAPRQSIAEPIRSQVHMQSPDQPIRHMIVTEDGQQLSVDINLKVLSPTPNSPPGHHHHPPPPVSNPPGHHHHPPPPVSNPPGHHHHPPPPVSNPPRGVELHTQAPPTLYQQNPAAFRPHVPRMSPRQAFVHQEAQLSPQHQLPAGHLVHPAGHPGNYGNQPANYGQPTSNYGTPPSNYGNPAPYGMQVPQGYDLEDEYMNYPEMSGQTASPHPSQQSTTPITSPYRVLPPIGSADTDEGRPDGQSHGPGGTSPGTQGGSYMAHYKHQRTKKQEYKEYTLDDYRKLKKEISLGGLGPDVDNETIKEKRDKRQRQLDYARSLRQRPPGSSPAHPMAPPAPDVEENDSLDKRKVALEYAKSVPKPKPRSMSQQHPSGTSSRNSGATNESNQHNHQVEVFDLEKLRQRHEKERQQVSVIRQNIEHYSQA